MAENYERVSNKLEEEIKHVDSKEADEEYAASCKLHVDSSAEAYIDIEYLAYLLEWFVKVFVE
ncbi:MAG: Fe-S cluster domain protein [Candidatus Scalindua rubra]|uniref:Fe-S cluster domain protein n=1 Tax=Candidatus Scalindua rubra TaxID=1872076 RepID=A0A1E3X3C4_9BACT|nr:MAG: Fe-S cluster domain protein [Candidatus Scalindua rubra]